VRVGRKRDGHLCYEPWLMFVRAETVLRHNKTGASPRYSTESECPKSLVCESKRKRRTAGGRKAV